MNPSSHYRKVMFSQACVILFTEGGVHGCRGGHAWLPGGGMRGCQGDGMHGLGGMCGCWGECMVARGHVWLLGGVCGCQGACVVAKGVHGYWGACVVAGGHVWQRGACMAMGGMHGKGGTCMVKGGVCGEGGSMHGIQRDTEIRSMSGRYASYWNAFLFYLIFSKKVVFHPILVKN